MPYAWYEQYNPAKLEHAPRGGGYDWSSLSESSSEELSVTSKKSASTVALTAQKTLFSLQIFPWPTQMADAQEE